jgi:two-component system LytT family sensor kinase
MNATSMSRRSHRWIWIAAAWTGLALVDATQTVFSMRASGMHHAWVRLFITLSLSWLPWALATPIVIRLGRRYPPRSVKPLVTWLVHAGTVAAIIAIVAAWATLLEIILKPWAPDNGPGPFFETWRYKLYANSLSSIILYAFTLALSYVFDSRVRLARQQTETARLNEELSNAQLNALRQQIAPHFIFNALNAVVGLVREGRGDAAVNMIVALSDFLRRVAKDFNDSEVRLSQEVEFLEKYLEIQKARFAGRLTLSLRVPEELLDAWVPSLILQPLVENAIKHGIEKRAQGGAVRIAASSSGGKLSLSVYNDGPLLEGRSEPHDGGGEPPGGIGLSNLRTRLKLLYGDDFELSLKNHEATGVQVSLSLPHRA